MQPINKILIINLMYIGDLLFTTPLLRTVRATFPMAHIAMLVDEKNTTLIEHNPHISELIAIDKKGYHNKLPNYLRLIADMRKRKFDLVINLHANERASAIAAFSGVKQIVGFSAKGFGTFFDCLVKERTDIHQVDAYLEVLKSLNITHFDNQGLEIWVDEATQQRADVMWEQTYPPTPRASKVIGFNTGGSWPTKRWTKIGFAGLADKLLDKGYGVAFFGGPMDKDDVQEIIALMKQKHHEQLGIFTGKTTLLEMTALVKKCGGFVTGDSGPMHIAASQHVPIVAIFGPSDSIRYAPYQQEGNIIRTGCPCQPCGQHTCTIGHICMKQITVDMVLDKLNPLLANSLL